MTKKAENKEKEDLMHQIKLYSEMTNKGEFSDRPVFRYVDLSEMVLSDLNLQGITLERCNLSHCHIYRCDLSFGELSGSNLTNVYGHDNSFEAAKLTHCDFRNAQFYASNFASVLGLEIDSKGAKFDSCDFKLSNISHIDLRDASLIRCDLENTNLEGAAFQYCNLEEANLTNTILHGTIMDKTYLADLKKALRQSLQKTGGLILYRTLTSPIMAKYKKHYKIGRTHKAHAFSHCSYTTCHPGIYAMPFLDDVIKEYPGNIIVKVYVPMGEWHFVSANKGFRCNRVRVLGELK